MTACTTHDVGKELDVDIRELTRGGGLLDRLSKETFTGQSKRGGGRRQKVSGSPAPWCAEPAEVFHAIRGAARGWETDLRLRCGFPPRERGGSDGNTDGALLSLHALAEAAGNDELNYTGELVSQWVREASTALDEVERWERFPRLPGKSELPCPYCGRTTLRMLKRSGRVMCVNFSCKDSDGRRPYARLELGRYSGQGIIVFRDDRVLFA